MESYLDQYSLKRVQVYGDGKCLYGSIAQLIAQDERYKDEIKETIVQEVGRCIGSGDEKIQEQILMEKAEMDGSDQRKFREYMKEIRKSSTYGSLIEVMAASKYYGFGFMIHSIDCGWRNEEEGEIRGTIQKYLIAHPSVMVQPSVLFHLVHF